MLSKYVQSAWISALLHTIGAKRYYKGAGTNIHKYLVGVWFEIREKIAHSDYKFFMQKRKSSNISSDL